MKPTYALNLSPDGIGLWHRSGRGWHFVGEVDLEDPAMARRLEFLRRTAAELEPAGITTKLVIPDSQIHYRTIDDAGSTDGEHAAAVIRAMEGATPYALDQLAIDWQPLEDGRVALAAVARETLREAEAFASDNRFNAVSFVGRLSPESDFPVEPFFGETHGAAMLLGPGERVERDTRPLPPRTASPAPPAPAPASPLVLTGAPSVPPPQKPEGTPDNAEAATGQILQEPEPPESLATPGKNGETPGDTAPDPRDDTPPDSETKAAGLSDTSVTAQAPEVPEQDTAGDDIAETDSPEPEQSEASSSSDAPEAPEPTVDPLDDLPEAAPATEEPEPVFADSGTEVTEAEEPESEQPKSETEQPVAPAFSRHDRTPRFTFAPTGAAGQGDETGFGPESDVDDPDSTADEDPETTDDDPSEPNIADADAEADAFWEDVPEPQERPFAPRPERPLVAARTLLPAAANVGMSSRAQIALGLFLIVVAIVLWVSIFMREAVTAFLVGEDPQTVVADSLQAAPSPETPGTERLPDPTLIWAGLELSAVEETSGVLSPASIAATRAAQALADRAGKSQRQLVLVSALVASDSPDMPATSALARAGSEIGTGARVNASPYVTAAVTDIAAPSPSAGETIVPMERSPGGSAAIPAVASGQQLPAVEAFLPTPGAAGVTPSLRRSSGPAVKIAAARADTASVLAVASRGLALESGPLPARTADQRIVGQEVFSIGDQPAESANSEPVTRIARLPGGSTSGLLIRRGAEDLSDEGDGAKRLASLPPRQDIEPNLPTPAEVETIVASRWNGNPAQTYPGPLLLGEEIWSLPGPPPEALAVAPPRDDLEPVPPEALESPVPPEVVAATATADVVAEVPESGGTPLEQAVTVLPPSVPGPFEAVIPRLAARESFIPDDGTDPANATADEGTPAQMAALDPAVADSGSTELTDTEAVEAAADDADAIAAETGTAGTETPAPEPEAELVAMLPRLRPDTSAVAPGAVEDALTEAVALEVTMNSGAEAFLPRLRPGDVGNRAVASAAQTPARSASIPTTASVARQATDKNVLRLRDINLIGITGAPSSRKAMVRLANGKIELVKAGDRLDSGKDLVISASSLTYQKNGRQHILEMPRG